MDRIRQGEQFIKQFLTSVKFSDTSQIIAKFYHSENVKENIVFVKQADSRFPDAPTLEQGNDEGTIIQCYFTKALTKPMTVGIWRVEFEITINDIKTLIYKPSVDVFAVQPTTIT